MNIQDSVTVITGGSQGLGAMLARDVARRGGRVIVADIHSESLHALAAEIGADAVECDVRDQDAVKKLAAEAIERYGRIDLWINNAGIWMPYMPAEEIDMTTARNMIDVNYFGVAHGTIEAKKQMKEQNSGIILNVLSVRALAGKERAAAYCASKFAAEGFTQSVRRELDGCDVRVVGAYPYRMKTKLFGADPHDDYADSMEPMDVARIILDEISLADPADHIEIWSPDDIRRISRV